MSNHNDMVLIVDDEKAIVSMLYKVLKSNGIEAETACNGEEALTLMSKNHYDLMLLDVNMPGIDGFEVVKTLRNRGDQTPIIIISGRQEDYDTLYGLDIGADDYITKPFNPITLGAKVKAMIRRTKQSMSVDDTILTNGPFSYNTSTLRFYKSGEEISLSARENAIVKLFMDNPNRIFPKDTIYDQIWGDSIIDDNAIMVYINRIRQKIEDDPSHPKYIQTVRGLGYRFVIK